MGGELDQQLADVCVTRLFRLPGMSVSREFEAPGPAVRALLPRLAKAPPASPGWIHEIKQSGLLRLP